MSVISETDTAVEIGAGPTPPPLTPKESPPPPPPPQKKGGIGGRDIPQMANTCSLLFVTVFKNLTVNLRPRGGGRAEEGGGGREWREV